VADLGLTQQQISAVKGISVATLTRYYAIELETGESALNAAVGRNLYRIATSEKANAVTVTNILDEDTGRVARDQPAGGQSRQ
jgi:hypothetical protein